jgi:hypothetical protein
MYEAVHSGHNTLTAQMVNIPVFSRLLKLLAAPKGRSAISAL